MLIDCEMYRTEQCDDCLVTALLHPPDTNVEIEDDLDPELRTLTDAGLIPVLRFRPREAGRARPPVPEADTG
jgi:hypothetical protein